MKKRILILTIILLVVSLPLMAEDFGQGRDMGAGHTKVGTILGRGFFGTVGFDSGGATEINVHAGTGWNFNYINIGANILFTMVDINIEGQIFPLSIGPQVDVTFGGGGFDLAILAMVRWEYTFWFPLNLFIEVGPGVGLNFNNGVGAYFDWRGGVGVRYVFGM